MKIIDKIYEFVVSIQLVLTFLFIVSNFDNLGSIEYAIDITEDISFEFELNLYLLITGIITIYIAIIAISIQVVGSGLNDEGTKNVNKLIGFVVIWLLLSIGSNYYFTFLEYSVLINLFITFVHATKMISIQIE